jgi:hypothetical protein
LWDPGSRQILTGFESPGDVAGIPTDGSTSEATLQELGVSSEATLIIGWQGEVGAQHAAGHPVIVVGGALVRIAADLARWTGTGALRRPIKSNAIRRFWSFVAPRLRNCLATTLPNRPSSRIIGPHASAIGCSGTIPFHQNRATDSMAGQLLPSPCRDESPRNIRHWRRALWIGQAGGLAVGEGVMAVYMGPRAIGETRAGVTATRPRDRGMFVRRADATLTHNPIRLEESASLIESRKKPL